MLNLDCFESNVVEFPARQNVVYVLFHGDPGKPFYVGETESFTGRMADYIRAAFGAPTDFKVGEAIRYLVENKVRVRVGYKDQSDRKAAEMREAELIEELRRERIPLLNDLPGYRYKFATKLDERGKVRRFCDQHILRPSDD